MGPTTLVTRTSSQESEEQTEKVPTAILTLALTSQQAEKLVFANQEAQLHFALLTPDSRPQPDAGVNADNLFTGTE